MIGGGGGDDVGAALALAVGAIDAADGRGDGDGASGAAGPPHDASDSNIKRDLFETIKPLASR